MTPMTDLADTLTGLLKTLDAWDDALQEAIHDGPTGAEINGESVADIIQRSASFLRVIEPALLSAAEAAERARAEALEEAAAHLENLANSLPERACARRRELRRGASAIRALPAKGEKS